MAKRCIERDWLEGACSFVIIRWRVNLDTHLGEALVELDLATHGFDGLENLAYAIDCLIGM